MGLRTYLGLKKSKRFRKRTSSSKNGAASYWEKRKDHNYLREIFQIARTVAPNARGIVDVGSNGCPYLEWFDWIPDRTSIDVEVPYASDSVRGIKADFFDWQPDQPFDLCLCLQVLEHIPDAEAFAQKLLRTAPQVIVSVPYKWPEGKCSYHVHDPVDEAKVERWFARSPDLQRVVRDGKSERLICHFATPGINRSF